MQSPASTLPSAPPPALDGSFFFGNLMDFHHDPLGFMERCAALGDITAIRFLNLRGYMLVHPDHVRSVLVEQQQSFVKGMATQGFRPLMGQGLFLSEGEGHKRQRRMMQPLFHKDAIARYTSVMLEEIAATDRRWQDGARVDMADEMNQLTLNIAARTLLGTGVTEEESAAIREAMSAFSVWYHQSTHPLGPLLQALPTATTRRFKRGKAGLSEVLLRMIRTRREAGEGTDLLSRLVFARDTEGDGAGMSEELLHDEALGLLIAGHETTAATLCWAWSLLSAHPEVADRLAAEVESVACNRTLQMEDLSNVPLAEQIFCETLRLYPSANALPRQAVRDVEVGGVPMPAGTLILVSAWCTHRDARWWPDPLRFQPERWSNEARASRPRFAWYPFGGGAKGCIGESFARVEGALVLAELARRWRARVADGNKIEIETLFTLRPKGGMPMILARR